jgi:hypothetical protein
VKEHAATYRLLAWLRGGGFDPDIMSEVRAAVEELEAARSLLAQIHEIAALRSPICRWGAPGEPMIVGAPMAALAEIARLSRSGGEAPTTGGEEET